MLSIFKKIKKIINPPQPFIQKYILENEIKIPLVFKDEMGRESNYSYSYGYENGYIKICLWGGTAYKKKCNESEVESIIAPIRDMQLNEHQVHNYLKKLGGFEAWDYYDEYFKSELIYL